MQIKDRKRWVLNKWIWLMLMLGITLVVFSSCKEPINQGGPVMIQRMDELEKIEGMGNVDRQIVIIYRDEDNPGIGELEIPVVDVKAGRTLSGRIDLIELSDPVDMDALIKEIERHPIVLVAEKNGTAQIMPE